MGVSQRVRNEEVIRIQMGVVPPQSTIKSKSVLLMAGIYPDFTDSCLTSPA
jgi:hypothetical protein